MKCLIRYLAPALITAVCVTATTIVCADDNEPRNGPNRYVVTPLASDLPNVAPNTDPVLQNAWGVAFTPGASPFWIADNATGCSTLYDGTGVPQPSSPLLVKIPLPGGSVPSTACQTVNPKNPNPPTNAAPTGLIWNPTTTFLVPNTTSPATFVFDTEDGAVSASTGGMTPPDRAVLAVDNSPSAVTRVWSSVPMSTVCSCLLLISEAERSTSSLPMVKAAFGQQPIPRSAAISLTRISQPVLRLRIQNINGNLFVTYALQNSAKHDDVAGAGNGFVDIFDTNGNLLRRFASHGTEFPVGCVTGLIRVWPVQRRHPGRQFREWKNKRVQL